MKTRIKKKKAKSPSKKAIMRQMVYLQRETAGRLAVADKTVSVLRAEMNDADARNERYRETTARVLRVLQDVAPNLRVFMEDKRRVPEIPEFARGGIIRSIPVERPDVKLTDATALPHELLSPVMLHYLHRLELEVTYERPRVYTFTFKEKPMAGAIDAIGYRFYITSDLIEMSPDYAVRYAFLDMCEKTWRAFKEKLDERKAVR